MPKTDSAARVAGLLIADGDGFVTRRVSRLGLTLEGIPGDRHFGHVRAAGSREPWYARGTAIRNDRQVTVVSTEDLEEIARRMDLPEVLPEWIGANVVVEGIDGFTGVGVSRRLGFASGAVLIAMGVNAPCRFAGAEIARHFPDRSGLDLLFPKVAKGLRGVIAAVERAGDIAPDDAISLR